jgi:hypothetical protein
MATRWEWVPRVAGLAGTARSSARISCSSFISCSVLSADRLRTVRAPGFRGNPRQRSATLLAVPRLLRPAEVPQATKLATFTEAPGYGEMARLGSRVFPKPMVAC